MADENTINGMSEEQFLAKYYHKHNSVSEIGLDWKQLVDLHDFYKSSYYHLNTLAQGEYIKLRDINGAYIVKYRVKDPEHVVDKAIRKKIEKGIVITKDNLLQNFDDLIGFRVLHLFKNGWHPIHDYITQNYELNEQPVVYHRKGDSDEFLNQCKEAGLSPIEKTAGYRSIHYIVKLKTINGALTSEIQVRTVIEDAWGEIDHLVRYPNATDNDVLNRYLLLFNTLAGSADEMGTFLMFLKQSILQKEKESQLKIDELTNTINDLRNVISKLKNVNKAQKEKIDGLMKKINSGIEIWRKPSDALYNYSINEYLNQIQNPSGLTGMSMIEDFQSSIKSILASPPPNTINILGSELFEMPKASTLIQPLSEILNSFEKDDENKNNDPQ